jgi:hypothetical protein
MFPIGNIQLSYRIVNTPMANTCVNNNPYSDADINDFLEGIKEVLDCIVRRKQRKVKKIQKVCHHLYASNKA